MRTIFTILLSLVILFACEKKSQDSTQKISVNSDLISLEISIVADSVNSIHMELSVEKGVGLQEIMEKTVKIGYADPAGKFINSIAGFDASTEKRQFWFLELDGEAAQVGVAEIKINSPAQITWSLKSY